jgi:hypothetical protein
VYAQKVIDVGCRDIQAISSAKDDDPAGPLYYWIGPQELWWEASVLALARNEPDEALAATDAVLRLVNPGRIRDVSRMLLYQADAHIQKGEVDTAAARLGDAAELIAQHRSPRVVEYFRATRARAGRNGTSRALTDLDDHVATLGLPLIPPASV